MWRPNFRIIKQKGPVSFIIKNQLDGTTKKAHAAHLRQANIKNWNIPSNPTDRELRNAAYVVPPVNNYSSDNDSKDHESIQYSDNLVRMNRHERETSFDEDNIPLMELSNRLRERNRANSDNAIENTTKSSHNSDFDDEESLNHEGSGNELESNASVTSDTDISLKSETLSEANLSDDEMDINLIQTKSVCNTPRLTA